jgi:hypothetical protein
MVNLIRGLDGRIVTKAVLKKMGCCGTDWIHLAENRKKGRLF